MNPDLSVNICGCKLKNPVIPASGTYGFGKDYESLYPIEQLGGIACKGITLEPREGNPPPRIAETPSGILNSVGLQNPGVEYFIEHELPYLSDKGTVIIANIAGKTAEDMAIVAKRLDSTNVDIIELNISCPNVKEGGVAFGTSCQSAAAVTKIVRKNTSKPLMVKLSPNVTDITEIARAVEGEGANAVSLINTLLGMRIDVRTRRPILGNNVGGLSGAAIFPVAVRMVWQVANAVKIPVVGMGGIYTAQDAIEMMLAGASAVQIGTVMFDDPFSPLKIIRGIEEYMKLNNISELKEIIGKVEVW